jgi:CheY-like chemotaxis protein
MRCVLVDDNRAFLEVARALLEREGVEVVGVAGNVADGVKRARALSPDVILVDIELGDESGVELAERLAREPGSPSPQLILMSAHREDDVTDLIEDGLVIGFLAKARLSRRAIDALLGRCPPQTAG